MAADANQRLEMVRHSAHHLLILSGLYGLVNARESIQRYTLSLLDSTGIASLWVGDSFLTRALDAYCRANGIERVFDLTGVLAYRSLVDWSLLAKSSSLSMLHVYAKWHAGDEALPTLGQLAGRLMQVPEGELRRVRGGQQISVGDEPVLYAYQSSPPLGYPREPGDDAPDRDTREYEAQGLVRERTEPTPVSSGRDSTTLGAIVRTLEDLPREAREILAPVAWMREVDSIDLSWYEGQGPVTHGFELRLFPPQQGGGLIRGKMCGSAARGKTQMVNIRVQPGTEYRVIDKMWERCPRVEWT